MSAADQVITVLMVALGLSLLLNTVALNCNLTLLSREKTAKADSKRAKAAASRDRASASMLAKSNAALREHTAEHCLREASLRALLAANGITVVAVSTDDLTNATTPADIGWGAES